MFSSYFSIIPAMGSPAGISSTGISSSGISSASEVVFLVSSVISDFDDSVTFASVSVVFASTVYYD